MGNACTYDAVTEAKIFRNKFIFCCHFVLIYESAATADCVQFHMVGTNLYQVLKYLYVQTLTSDSNKNTHYVGLRARLRE